MSRPVLDMRGHSLGIVSGLPVLFSNWSHTERTAQSHRSKASHVSCLNSIVDTLKNTSKNRKLIFTWSLTPWCKMLFQRVLAMGRTCAAPGCLGAEAWQPVCELPGRSFLTPRGVQCMCRERRSKLRGEDSIINPKDSAFLVNYLKAFSVCRRPFCNCLAVSVRAAGRARPCM